MEVTKQRHRILLSAYACEPDKGSEPGVGWNWAVHLSEFFDVYVITRKNNKKVIEDYLRHYPIMHLHFYYYDCSGWMRKAKKLPNGIFIYYKKWQTEILPVVKKIVYEKNIEIIHHVTFNEFRTPGKLWSLGVPFVWGPIGGGQFYSPVFKNAYFKKSDIIKENIRNVINCLTLRYSNDIRQAVRKAAAILIADQSTEKLMPKTRNYIRLLETGYDVNRNKIKSYITKGEKDIKLLWVGGIWPRKGLKLLIDALGNSHFRSFQLDIIGTGNDRQQCEDLVASYGMTERVRFLGALPYNEVNEYYDEVDVFVFTSLRDTSGNVVLEAMAHGLPVIALNHHGVGEIVTQETGTLIDITDYSTIRQKIVDAIQGYHKDRASIDIKGRAGRKRIEEIYSWKHNAEIMRQVYLKILEGK